MKNYRRFLPILVMAVIFAGVAQSRATPQNKELAEPYFTFVVIETAITKEGVEVSDEYPQESRFYVSNVIEFPGNPQLKRKANEIANDYFTKTVVEPMEAKGFLHEYYLQDVRIDNDAVYTPASRAEAEKLREETLEDLKGRGANIFTFVWQYGKEPKGLETAALKLFHRDPGEPVYGETSGKN